MRGYKSGHVPVRRRVGPSPLIRDQVGFSSPVISKLSNADKDTSRIGNPTREVVQVMRD
jgi:hypothetical protein